MVIERAFALLKGRFRRLKYVDIDKVDDIPKIVIAACVLHNISLCNEDIVLDFMDNQDDEVNEYESILTPNSPAVQKRTEIMEYLTQIDFCLLFRASKNLKQHAEICLH